MYVKLFIENFIVNIFASLEMIILNGKKMEFYMIKE